VVVDAMSLRCLGCSEPSTSKQVLTLGLGLKMLRVHTSPMRALVSKFAASRVAEVIDLQACWDRANEKFIAVTVSLTALELAVSVLVLRPEPQPTISSLVHIRPEATLYHVRPPS
jgi:hypothetical protein